MTTSVRNRKVATFGVLLALLPTACLDPVEPLEVVLWEGALQSAPSASLQVDGSIAMVANAASTQVGIGVQVAGEEAPVLTWSLFQGRCGVAGEPVVAEDLLPPLVPDSEGSASAEYLINRRVDPAVSYGVRVGIDAPEGPGSAPPEWLACGDLTRRRR